ncbi:MAG: DUF5615 family PIN-like protein [Acidobacteria bacterium]|jgi:predicted nuclease of predicted toxin-antitoxin system|nr:DUF5615 family PIN-like protein [Acidobacteriota bacterium]
MFVKTYLDENISVVVAEILRSRGFEAVTTQEAGNKGLSDEQQLEFASDFNRFTADEMMNQIIYI